MTKSTNVLRVRLVASMAALCGGLLAACAAAVEPAPAPGPALSGDSLAALQALIGDAACSGDAQCRTVGVGARACGGPDAYLAWSTARTDAAALDAAAQRHAAARRKANESGRSMSICRFEVDPGAVCAPADGAGARHCVLNRSSEGVR